MMSATEKALRDGGDKITTETKYAVEDSIKKVNLSFSIIG